MSNLSAASPRAFVALPQYEETYTISGTATIWEGSALSDVSSSAPGVAGTNVAATLTAGENFLGFCTQTVKANSGPVTINVRTDGVTQLKVTGLTAASLGAAVFASDGNTFLLTRGSNSYVGTVKRIVDVTALIADVEFHALKPEQIVGASAASADRTLFTFVNGVATAVS